MPSAKFSDQRRRGYAVTLVASSENKYPGAGLIPVSDMMGRLGHHDGGLSHHISVMLLRFNLRVAAAIALGTTACAGLSACAADAPPAATSGSSTRTSAWVHTPNEPNWQSPSYTAH
jgi:hypothetical protein